MNSSFILISSPQKSVAVIGYTTALYDYIAQSEVEISLKEGDQMAVISIQPNGWWVGCSVTSKVAGFFPSNYCNTKLVSELEHLPVAPLKGEKDNQTDDMIKKLTEQLELEKAKTKAAEEAKDYFFQYSLSQLQQLSSILQPQSND